MILGYDIDRVSVIENPSYEGWRLQYAINDNIGVFKSDYGEIRHFSRKEVYKLISENDKEWEMYYESD